jgi:hypothetical protein
LITKNGEVFDIEEIPANGFIVAHFTTQGETNRWMHMVHVKCANRESVQ